VGAEALAEDELGLREIEGGVEGCAFCVLDGVFGPEGLGAVGGFYGLVVLFVVGGGEGDVFRRMPVLGEDYVGEFCGEGVDGWYDRVAFFYCQGSAGAEVVLEIDHQKRVRVLNGYAHRFCFLGDTPLPPIFRVKYLDTIVCRIFDAKILHLNGLRTKYCY
jgi:hypothetical protein